MITTDFNTQLEKIGEYGVVEQVHHPIVQISGLPGAHMHEIVIFEDGGLGEVFQIEADNIDILVYSKEPQKVGMKVTRSDEFSAIPVGEEMLGTIVDPLGNSLSDAKPTQRTKDKREINTAPLGIPERVRIKKALETGVTLIDIMVPLGMGQKELIIGDRKTGKTSFILSTMKNQILKGTVAIYVAVAKKKSEIKKVQEFFEKEGLSHNVIIVATSSYDSPSLIYLSPYSGMALAEYFRDQGKDVLIAVDDLTTHARFYREISLLAKRFPGRDSYPGDIFYTHARLLERTGNYSHPTAGEVSITLLPVAEIVEGDFTGYISTNLMGMTDGHIYFDSNIYYNGRRPAAHILLSVTRVGRQTSTAVAKSINRELTSFFAIYEKMQSLSHFGAELTDTVTNILKTGEAVYKFFNQPYELVIPLEVQLTMFSLLWLKFFENDIENIPKYRLNLTNAYANDPHLQEMFQKMLAESKTFNDLLGKIAPHKDELLKICGKESQPQPNPQPMPQTSGGVTSQPQAAPQAAQSAPAQQSAPTPQPAPQPAAQASPQTPPPTPVQGATPAQ